MKLTTKTVTLLGCISTFSLVLGSPAPASNPTGFTAKVQFYWEPLCLASLDVLGLFGLLGKILDPLPLPLPFAPNQCAPGPAGPLKSYKITIDDPSNVSSDYTCVLKAYKDSGCKNEVEQGESKNKCFPLLNILLVTHYKWECKKKPETPQKPPFPKAKAILYDNLSCSSTRSEPVEAIANECKKPSSIQKFESSHATADGDIPPGYTCYWKVYSDETCTSLLVATRPGAGADDCVRSFARAQDVDDLVGKAYKWICEPETSLPSADVALYDRSNCTVSSEDDIENLEPDDVAKAYKYPDVLPNICHSSAPTTENPERKRFSGAIATARTVVPKNFECNMRAFTDTGCLKPFTSVFTKPQGLCARALDYDSVRNRVLYGNSWMWECKPQPSPIYPSVDAIIYEENYCKIESPSTNTRIPANTCTKSGNFLSSNATARGKIPDNAECYWQVYTDAECKEPKLQALSGACTYNFNDVEGNSVQWICYPKPTYPSANATLYDEPDCEKKDGNKSYNRDAIPANLCQRFAGTTISPPNQRFQSSKAVPVFTVPGGMICDWKVYNGTNCETLLNDNEEPGTCLLNYYKDSSVELKGDSWLWACKLDGRLSPSKPF